MQLSDCFARQGGFLFGIGARIKRLWQRLLMLWPKKSPPAQRLLLPKVTVSSEIPRYPPFSEGLPATPIEAILASQNELIERLRATLGLTPEEFNRWIKPVLSRYAAFVHLLPASEHHHHRGAGGLWRHSLEVAWERHRPLKPSCSRLMKRHSFVEN